MDNDESCPTADRSNIGRPNGPAYSTGELLNTALVGDVLLCLTINTASTSLIRDPVVPRRRRCVNFDLSVIPADRH